MSVVYHSMPVSVIKNPIYRKEFMLKFGDHVQHILDTPETNKPELARKKALLLTKRIK